MSPANRESAVLRIVPTQVTCPFCWQPPGKRCVSRYRAQPVKPHRDRVDAAEFEAVKRQNAPPLAYREGSRIRHPDGHGYSDLVSDDTILAHIEKHLEDLDQGAAAMHKRIAFAAATLRLRLQERAEQELRS